MKLFAIAVLAFIVGLVVGLQFAAREVIAQTHRQASTLGAAQRLLASVSLRALDELQAGRVDQAKSFLAGQVAIYYNTIQQLDTLSEKQELLQHIQATSNNSPELKNALSKKPQ
jgi:hypothetical protein